MEGQDLLADLDFAEKFLQDKKVEKERRGPLTIEVAQQKINTCTANMRELLLRKSHGHPVVHMHVHMYNLHMCMYGCTYVCIYVCISMYTCVYPRSEMHQELMSQAKVIKALPQMQTKKSDA